MQNLNIEIFLEILDEFISAKLEFSAVREFVFQFYDDEQEFIVDEKTEILITVLTPYLEHEESWGDTERYDRMKRIRTVLQSDSNLTERLIFALRFSEIKILTNKLKNGIITKHVYCEQIGKLSPIEYDVQIVCKWAACHMNENFDSHPASRY